MGTLDAPPGATRAGRRPGPLVGRRILLLLVAGAVLAVGAAVAGASRRVDTAASHAPPAAARGGLISATPLLTTQVDQVSSQLATGGWREAKPRYGVEAIRLEYRTLDAAGGITRASGVLALPQHAAKRLRVVSYLHGTTIGKQEVASVDVSSRAQAPLLLFAGAGYAVVAPDYVGLGSGPGTHPYMHAPSEVSASLDMLRAARTYASSRGVELDPRILVTGFSQGGHVAVELAHAVQDGASPPLSLAALAGVSGPYAVREVQEPAMLSGRIDPRAAVLYTAYWTVAMNRLHHFYVSPSEVFAPPYASTVEDLFDGSRQGSQVAADLPADPRDLFTPAYLTRLGSPSGALADALRASGSGCDWGPKAPVRLFASTGDRDVPYQHAVLCRQRFAARGAEVTVVDLGHVWHGQTFVDAMPQVLSFFREQASA